jgi:hypothetical protein
LTLLVALAAPASAQLTLYFGPIEHRNWHSTISGAAQFTGSTAGYFDRSGYPDVVVLSQQTPHILSSPGAVNALYAIEQAPGGCTVVATSYQGLTPKGRREDKLLVSNGAGLYRWWRFAQWPTPQWQLELGTDWASLRQLVVADVNADGLDDLVAICADQRRIRVRLGAASGYGQEYTALIGAIFSLATINWDADPAREIAVATASGLRIFDYDRVDRAPIATINGTASSAAMLATLRNGNTEFLTMTANNGGVWSLYRVDSLNPASTTLGNLDLVACAVGDMNGDGDDDLLYSKRSSHRATAMFQFPGRQFLHAPGYAYEVPLIGSIATPNDSIGPAPANNAVPALADFDADGDADIVHAVESTKRLAVVRAPFGAAAPLRVLPTRSDTRSNLDNEGNAFKLNLCLEQTSAFPSDATHIELICWRQTGVIGGSMVYCGGPGSVQYKVAPLGASTTFAFSLQEHESLFTVGYAYFAVARLVRQTGAVITKTYQPLTFYFASNDFPEGGFPYMTLDFVRSQAVLHNCTTNESLIERLEGPGMFRGGGGQGAHAADGGKGGKQFGISTSGGLNGGSTVTVTPPPPVGGGGGGGGGGVGPG